MSKPISIRDDLYELLKGEKQTGGLSSSEKIDLLKMTSDRYQRELESLQETTVTQEGRISKTLAGKTILYKVKD